jgi:hypothetical protein
MSEHQPQPVQQTMPEGGDGWHQINAGPCLHVMFHPDRQLLGREADGIERPSIVVAVSGKREQALRFDPFSMGSHYHIRPSLRGRQIPLWIEEGQQPLDIALAFFEKPLRFRGLLAQAEEDEAASHLDDADLANAARQIREVYAAVHQDPTALLARIDRIERRLARLENQMTPA